MRKLLSTALLAAGLITQANAAPVQWTIASGGNGHWYEFIDSNVTWSAALTSAQGMSFMGMTGYLATAVDANENRFISATVAQGALSWLSGSDDGSEGSWTWRAGPETGLALTFFSWNAGEPNNCCNGENFLQTNWGGTGLWNDHGGPGNGGQVNGYVVEFSGTPNNVPEPASLALVMAAGLAGVGVARRRAR